MSTHYLCFEQKYEEYQNFSSEIFHFLVVKFSVYLNRHVFVMKANRRSEKQRIKVVENAPSVPRPLKCQALFWRRHLQYLSHFSANGVIIIYSGNKEIA